MTASKVFLYFCLSFAGGIFISSFLKIPLLVQLGFLVFGLILIAVLWPFGSSTSLGASKLRVNENKKKITVLGFCVLFLVLGIWRHQEAKLQIANSELQKYNNSGQEISLTGIVAAEPDIRESSIKLTVINDLGKALVTTNRYPEYRYGDKLKLTGKLKTPSDDIEGFNYREYLSKDGISSGMSWPKIEKIAENKGNKVYSVILSFKEKLRQVLYQNLSPPQSSVLGAIILGDKRQLSEDLKNNLNLAGVRHITAISGMHIMILAGILMAFFVGIGFWRGQAFYFAIFILVLYIIMVGAPASAVRAGIMGGLFLLAQKVGRSSASSRAIVFVAAIMLLQNPLILKTDVGFQLSFLAVMGIIYLMPLFQNLLAKLPNYGIFPLRNILAMTLAAQVFTLPILIFNFGYISLVAPFANILIVPLIPLVMMSGFIFGIAGMILPILGQVLSWFSWVLLTYILKIVDLFSAIPFAAVEIKNINWLWLAGFYLILIFFVWRQREKEKLKFLDY